MIFKYAVTALDIDIEHDCRISYENSRFSLRQRRNKDTVISLDSGIRILEY